MLKNLYYYFFYVVYKFWDWISFPKFATSFKAIITIIALEVWIYFYVLNNYLKHKNSNSNLEVLDAYIILPFLLIILINYISFIQNEAVWKKMFQKFNNLPSKLNLIGKIIVFVILMIFIIILR